MANSTPNKVEPGTAAAQYDAQICRRDRVTKMHGGAGGGEGEKESKMGIDILAEMAAYLTPANINSPVKSDVRRTHYGTPQQRVQSPTGDPLELYIGLPPTTSIIVPWVAVKSIVMMFRGDGYKLFALFRLLVH